MNKWRRYEAYKGQIEKRRGFMYITIAKTARVYGLPEFRLRHWAKQGLLPGFQSGNRFYVNCDKLMDQIEEIGAASVRMDKEGNGL